VGIVEAYDLTEAAARSGINVDELNRRGHP